MTSIRRRVALYALEKLIDFVIACAAAATAWFIVVFLFEISP